MVPGYPGTRRVGIPTRQQVDESMSPYPGPRVPGYPVPATRVPGYFHACHCHCQGVGILTGLPIGSYPGTPGTAE
eukprot:574107-Rhodomonas_salina.2